jgi:hypothetical protein
MSADPNDLQAQIDALNRRRAITQQIAAQMGQQQPQQVVNGRIMPQGFAPIINSIAGIMASRRGMAQDAQLEDLSRQQARAKTAAQSSALDALVGNGAPTDTSAPTGQPPAPMMSAQDVFRGKLRAAQSASQNGINPAVISSALSQAQKDITASGPDEPPSRQLNDVVDANGKHVFKGYNPKTNAFEDVAGDIKPYEKPASILGTIDLTGGGLDFAAEKFRQTGQMPTIARSPNQQVKIINRAAELAQANGDSATAAVLGQQANKAGQMALGQLTKQKTLVGAFEKTANKNLDLALQLSDKVDRTGSPIINKGIIHFKQGISGDPDTAAFVNALTSARTEYAKVLSGATGASGVTDSARKESEELFNTAQNPEQLKAAIATAKQEMANRMSSFDQQASELQPTLTGKKPTTGEHPPEIQSLLDKYK